MLSLQTGRRCTCEGCRGAGERGGVGTDSWLEGLTLRMSEGSFLVMQWVKDSTFAIDH